MHCGGTVVWWLVCWTSNLEVSGSSLVFCLFVFLDKKHHSTVILLLGCNLVIGGFPVMD